MLPVSFDAMLTHIFSYFGVIIMSIFNMATYMGYNILNCILGGQTLSSVSSGHLTWTYVALQLVQLITRADLFIPSVGIVIIALISLFVRRRTRRTSSRSHFS